MKKGTFFIVTIMIISMLTACGEDNNPPTTSKIETTPKEPEETIEFNEPEKPEEIAEFEDFEDPADEAQQTTEVEEEIIDVDEIRHEYPDIVFYTYEDYIGTDWNEIGWQDINIIGPGPAGHIKKDEYGLPVQDEFWLADGSFDGVGYLLCCGAKHVAISPNFISAYFGRVHSTTYGTTEDFPLLRISSTSSDTTSTIAFFNFEIRISSSTTGATTSFYDTSKYPSQNYPIDTYAIQQIRGLTYAYKNCDLYATQCPLDGMGIAHTTSSMNGNAFTCTESN